MLNNEIFCAYYTLCDEGFPHSSIGKESACNAGDPFQFLGREDSLEKGIKTLENPMVRGAWQATVHGITRAGHGLATKPPLPHIMCDVLALAQGVLPAHDLIETPKTRFTCQSRIYQPLQSFE